MGTFYCFELKNSPAKSWAIFFELEHKVIREAGSVSLNRLIQVPCSDIVEFSQIFIQHYLFLSYHIDLTCDKLVGDQDVGFLFSHSLSI